MNNLAWILSLISGLMLWLMGNKSKWGPRIGILNQFLWIIYAIGLKQWGLLLCTAIYGFVHIRNLWKWEAQRKPQEEIPAWFLDTVKDSVLAPSDTICIELSDVSLKMEIQEGLAEDIDIESERDVFRFAPVPMSQVEISIPWDSTSLLGMKSFVEHYISFKKQHRKQKVETA
jgi:hypothetical protein